MRIIKWLLNTQSIIANELALRMSQWAYNVTHKREIIEAEYKEYLTRENNPTTPFEVKT